MNANVSDVGNASSLEYAPIVVLCFNRPKLLAATLANLSRCFDVEKHGIYIYADGARKRSDEAKIVECKNLILEYKKSELSQIELVERGKNLGGVANARMAITQIVEEFGRVIVVEDDILVSRTFLQYVEMGLRKYKDNLSVWGINGYIDHKMRVPKEYKLDVFCAPRNSVWGWGTWKDRWNAVDFEIKDWKTNKEHLCHGGGGARGRW